MLVYYTDIADIDTPATDMDKDLAATAGMHCTAVLTIWSADSKNIE